MTTVESSWVFAIAVLPRAGLVQESDKARPAGRGGTVDRHFQQVKLNRCQNTQKSKSDGALGFRDAANPSTFRPGPDCVPTPTLGLTKSIVKIVPTKLREAHINMTVSSPNALAAGANMVAPTTAPNLPKAADIPFNVDRQAGEKVILGSIKVVVFGP